MCIEERAGQRERKRGVPVEGVVKDGDNDCICILRRYGEGNTWKKTGMWSRRSGLEGVLSVEDKFDRRICSRPLLSFNHAYISIFKDEDCI